MVSKHLHKTHIYPRDRLCFRGHACAYTSQYHIDPVSINISTGLLHPGCIKCSARLNSYGNADQDKAMYRTAV
ncbi:hypothetical protein P8C59_006352 [Phyllachora maydis]|uniref:Uncharacterized protein n=1 Tax=Phyllachora maydis TaxID=1825666 RepID=A0AAD9MGL9_9PEZI|nr:hypothetical protein P8C59_006352 [Phyllachora maydis]